MTLARQVCVEAGIVDGCKRRRRRPGADAVAPGQPAARAGVAIPHTELAVAGGQERDSACICICFEEEQQRGACEGCRCARVRAAVSLECAVSSASKYASDARRCCCSLSWTILFGIVVVIKHPLAVLKWVAARKEMEKVRVELKFDVASEDGGADSGGGEEDVRKGSEASDSSLLVPPYYPVLFTGSIVDCRSPNRPRSKLLHPALSSAALRSRPKQPRRAATHPCAAPPHPVSNRRTFARSRRAGDAVRRVARHGYELMRAFPGRTPASNKQLGRA